MWGIEEAAWTLELFFHLRFKRWLSLMAMTLGRMLLGKNCIPTGFLFLLLPSARDLFFSLDTSTRMLLVGIVLVQQLATWLQVALREFALRRYILSDRKHMKPAGWKNWILLATPLWLVVEQLSLFFFFTCATWSMLWHARSHNTILYVTAPKAFITSAEETNGTMEKEATAAPSKVRKSV
jgi:hypothetical protein